MKKAYRHNKAIPSLSRAWNAKSKRIGEKRTRREAKKHCANQKKI
jgi:hypothetical protein